jgi:hypothetical protein
MDARRVPAAVLAAAVDRQGGAVEVAALAVDGLLEVAADPPLLEEAVAVLLAGQPAMAPIWHLARAARAPDPAAALADLRRRLDADADAAVTAATAWLLHHLADDPGPVATVSHSSLVDRVLTQAGPQAHAGPQAPARLQAQTGPPFSVRRLAPRRGSLAEPAGGGPELSTAPSGPAARTGPVDPAGATPVVGVVGADAVGPRAILNAVGTRELAAWLPTLVVATAIKLVPAQVFDRLAGPGFEVVPLAGLAAVVVGGEVVSPAEAGRRAEAVSGSRP